ncbi:rap guanine nucleotide exchange factor 1-like [Archocentrus centrarchus]|uniref:rap guanine nucleotide exchange factor 1-like n=1 Tax=Archocentrus centrarchus TaxID=63155 RepID=UPI0011E9BAA6|nr:rap guanine nucleotide exchange factor 1-like [Archocentrus centrarchus]
MSSRADSKTGSQIAYLTMRLKDKLHPRRINSERIKHPPSLRVKPPDLNLQQQQQHQSAGVLADQQRAVVSSLQYFKALVDKLGLDKPGVAKPVLDQSVLGRLLGGASGGVLETVQILVQLEPRLHSSKTITACLNRLHQSLAQLIRWADQVMLQSVSHDKKESTESVTKMIRTVLDNIKELVRLAAERQEGSVPLSPVQPESSTFDDQETSTCRNPADEKENKGVEIEKRREGQILLAPPKPPMPLPDPIIQVMPQEEQSPPALPPKKRQSTLNPTPCRVAIVAPMRREPEIETQTEQDCEDDYLKRHSAGSFTQDTHTDEDPDYAFLDTDQSSSDTLPPLPGSSCPPPALPEKRRRSTTGNTSAQTQLCFEFDSTSEDQSDAQCDEPVSSPLSPSKTPPPLPEKKRHIHQYLQFCSSYSDQSPVMFYQRSQALSQRYNSRHREVDASYQLSHTNLDTHLDPDFTPSPELVPLPILPLKKKQQDSDDRQTEDSQSGDSSQSVQQEVECSSNEEQDEVLLTDQQNMLSRITMKSEEEEGPDVKAASPDVLLVYATQTSSSEQDLYREAFLCTYRSFIGPNDVISKLQHRYRHLCDRREPTNLTAAKNTFHLLVSVVDELCAIELDSDVLQLLMDLVFSLLIGGELGLAHQLRSNILSKMEKKWQLICSPQSLRPLAAKGVAARPGTLLDFRSQDLAEQLTLLDAELFSKIELPEVLLWSKEQNEEKSPNLTEFTQHFNNVSFWVRSVIILQDKPQDRERLLLKFLKIMKHLRKLNNFNSYLSILSALDSAPLRRLDWQKSTSEALEEFSTLIDSSSSFRAYRAALAEVEPPCIPYLGLILQDLTFVHLGNPDTLMTSQGSKVNFSKRWQQFNILDTLRSYQQVTYSLLPDDEIISFFNDFGDHLAEEALWELSLRIRPKNTPRANQR